MIRKIYHFLLQSLPRTTEISRYAIECLYVGVIDLIARIKLNIMGHPKLKSYQVGKKFHFGCGSYILEEYINVDVNPAADIRLDLRKKLPFGDNLATDVYTEHFVEHLAYPDEVDQFFSEVHRILKDKGEFKISVPDAEMATRMTLNESEGSYAAFSKAYHAEWCTTDFEHLNYLFRQRTLGMSFLHFECHRFAYDFATLKKALLRAGFRQVNQRPHEHGLDQECHMLESLRVTAIK